MRNPAFCICQNKAADQLRGNHEADQRLCFRYIDSTIPLLSKSEILSLKPSSVAIQPGLCWTGRKPECWFSYDAARMLWIPMPGNSKDYGSVSIAQWLEWRPSNLAVVRSSPGWRCTYMYVPAMLRSKYLMANKGYAWHEFVFFRYSQPVYGQKKYSFMVFFVADFFCLII